MPKLSDLPGTTPRGILKDKFVPFTAFLQADPIGGKRFETVRSLERQAAKIENDLELLCDSDSTDPVDPVFDYTIPIAFTPQFGDFGPRFTVSGHACRRDTFTKTPVGERDVIVAGERKTGPGAANAWSSNSDPELEALAKELRDLLEGTTGLKVFRMDLNGYIFGRKGVHFPQ
jgi:hypothetical protein